MYNTEEKCMELAEKFKKMPMRIMTVTRVSRTLSTVHHQLAIMLRLFREKEITRQPPTE